MGFDSSAMYPPERAIVQQRLCNDRASSVHAVAGGEHGRIGAEATQRRLPHRDGGRAVQDETKGALRVVLAEHHDRPREIRILQLRHRQQQRRRECLVHHVSLRDSSRATRARSATKRVISACRVSSSGARRIDDGWTVAVTRGASGEGTKLPRLTDTLNDLPSSAWAAVAP